MIDASTFLRRALLADAIFSGVAALGFTFGANAFAALFNLPEALLRETGLFLIAYAALVGWLASRASVAKPLVLLVVVGNAAWTVGSIALLFSGAVSPNLAGESHGRRTGDRHRRVRRAAICGDAAKQHRCGRVTLSCPGRAAALLRCCAEPGPMPHGSLADRWAPALQRTAEEALRCVRGTRP